MMKKSFNSLKAGAMGYLVKGESMDKILSSIRDVHSGGAPMSFSIARRVLKHFEKKLPKSKVLMNLPNVKRKFLNSFHKVSCTRKLPIRNSSASIP
jgi:DNA-binding NarL/FixJ family response regulator